LAWSLSAWYWARTMLSLRLPGMEQVDRRTHRLRIWTPRLLGFFATLGVAAAFQKAAGGYAADEHAQVKELLEFYAFWCAAGAGAVAFLGAVWARRGLARAAYRVTGLEFLDLPQVHEHVQRGFELTELGRLTRWLLRATILASVLAFVVIACAVQEVAPALG